MIDLLATFKAEIDAILLEITALRHAIHREPELALNEYMTRARVLEALQGEELAIREPLLGTDLIAEVGNGEPLIALRADIDALPINEENELSYRSVHDGIMHACGHDGHTAMLVGAAKVLARHRVLLSNRVRFIFQPGEEIRAAGKDLVARGACEGAGEVYAIHAWTGLPAGTICTRVGTGLAAAGFFTITVIGRGCHGAHPELGLNPIPIATRVVERLHGEHLRLHERDGSVISVCAFNAGTNGNVIPERVLLQGTVRYLQAGMADEMEQLIKGICVEIAGTSGATIELDYSRNYELPLVNTEMGYRKVRRVAELAFGGEAFVEMEKPAMGAEDFAYYLPGREGAMVLLGQGEEMANGHSSRYNFNDETLAAGILTYCLLGLAKWE